MTHVVTPRCIDCRYTDCVLVCPVSCFVEVEDPAMLVIDPDTCIDCGLCVSECPVNAIFADTEIPEHYAEMPELNKLLVTVGTPISDPKGPVDGALDLAGVRTREAEAGMPNQEPGGA